MRAVQLVPFLLLAACFDPAKAPSCTIMCATSSDCPDGLTCGAGNLCTTGEDCTMPATCTPNEFVACLDGSTARSCNATGDGTVDQACGNPGCNSVARRCNSCVPDEVSCTGDTMAVQQCMADGSAEMVTDSCAQGCVAASGMVPAHCAYLSPQWLPDVCDQVATMDSYVPNSSGTVTSSLDTNCTQIIMQAVGPQICVVRAKSIMIPNLVTLTIDGTRAMAFVADTSLDVLGTIDASANGSTNGPGVFRTSGVAGTSTAAGGGAGFGTAGASGGNGTNTGGAALDPITLSYFAGGAHAASGTGIFDPAGGGGGGGLLLIACRGEVTVSGVIDAGGGGGRPGYDTTLGGGFTPSKSAAGGGTGGYVVLQGLTVKVDGQIYANGGGGGAGNTMDDGNATAGGDGLRSTSPASGGSPSGGGAGGTGGSLGNAPGAGQSSGTAYAGGGGGGAVGVLQIYTPMNVTPMTTGTVSPSFTAKKNSTLR